MKYMTENVKLLKKEQLTKTIFRFTVFAPLCSANAKPGQFANILVPGKTLRRPISICDIDKEKGLLMFVFEIRGDGTRILSEMCEGDDLDILAPLGNGFDIEDTSKKVVFVGGGIGVPPLLAGAKQFGTNASVLLGFRNKAAVILAEDFAKTGAEVKIATDDGSLGYNGFVTDLLKKRISDCKVDAVYACGPMPMLKIIAGICEENSIECQVSLEERMGCGIGACLVCACKIKTKNGDTYYHVCKDGPVFNAKEVEWNA